MKSRPTMARDRIILAVDLEEEEAIRNCVDGPGQEVGVTKFGLEAIHAIGTPRLVKDVGRNAKRILIDGKLHDIPTTMGNATKQVAKLGAWGVTIHATAGREGIKACVDNRGETLILGVTVLTSHNEKSCEASYRDLPISVVLKFAEWLVQEGAQGVICSPKEASAIRKIFGNLLLIVTPSIRPQWAATNDQKRATTPAEADEAGADLMVIGRPILKPPPAIGTPRNAIARIVQELGG